MQSSIEETFNYTPYVILTDEIIIDFFQFTNPQFLDCLKLFNLRNVIDMPTGISPNAAPLKEPVVVSDSCKVL